MMAADKEVDGPVEPVLPPKTLEDVLDGAIPGRQSSVKQYEKEGGMEDAIGDFNAIVAPGSVEAKEKEGVQVGNLPDGRIAIVRGSTQGSPTLEIQRADDHKSVIKIRYKTNKSE